MDKKPIENESTALPQRRQIDKVVTSENAKHSLIESDRIPLVSAANELVSTMVTKQVLPLVMSSVPSSIELDEQEAQAYRSALNFLNRQFELGGREPETYQSEVSTNKTLEFGQLEGVSLCLGCQKPIGNAFGWCSPACADNAGKRPIQ